MIFSTESSFDGTIPEKGDDMSKLKDIRIKRGLTQAQLADQAKINLRTLQSYEATAGRSINGASAEDVARMARVLHCISEDILEDF